MTRDPNISTLVKNYIRQRIEKTIEPFSLFDIAAHIPCV